ncbi:amino acid ABC transporter permease [Oscillospiraceae bacterium PP1C4]
MTWSEILTTTAALMQGVGSVIVLFIIVLLASMPIGFLITLMTRSKINAVRWLSKAYVYVIRGTPLMLQLFFVYFGLPYIPVIGKYIVLSGFASALLGFTLNYAAYFAEIFRGGLLSVDKGQYEACQVLGLSKLQTTTHVILPQMIRVALPSVTNESITLVKDTALMFAIAVPEILHYAKVAVSRTASIVPFVIAFAIYLILNTVLQLFFDWLEKKISY